MSDAQKREYAEGLGALYGCEPEKVARARARPGSFMAICTTSTTSFWADERKSF